MAVRDSCAAFAGAALAPSIERRHDRDHARSRSAAIECRRRAIGGRTIWSDVTLEVQAGEFVAVLGPNGVGKSTLLKAVLGLQPLDVRQVRGARVTARAGQCARRLPAPAARLRSGDAHARRRHRAPGLGRRPLGYSVARVAVARACACGARAGATRCRRWSGAEGYAHRPIGQCSGGEQQRLLIAQALVRRPDLLLLDEPLDSLDVTNQASVSALIQSVCRDQGVAVMLVAHDVNPILPLPRPGHLPRARRRGDGPAGGRDHRRHAEPAVRHADRRAARPSRAPGRRRAARHARPPPGTRR